MIRGSNAARYGVRLSVPRVGGTRAWGRAAGDFERRLAAQESDTVAGPRVEGQIRRGRDYVRVTVTMTVTAADPAQALVVAWRVFRKAAGDDIAGWDTDGASAEVRPGERLGARPAAWAAVRLSQITPVSRGCRMTRSCDFQRFMASVLGRYMASIGCR